MEDYSYTGPFRSSDEPTPRRNEPSTNHTPVDPQQRKRRRAQRPEPEPDEQGLFSRMVSFFASRRTRMVLGIALILLAGYLAVAALSFIKHVGDDQSRMAQQVSELAATPGAVENIAGPVGAKATYHLFVEGLGLGSIVLIVYLVFVALALLGLRKMNFWSTTFKSLIFAITISMAFGLITIDSDALVPLGGYHGRYINELLIANVGWVGAFAVSALLVATLIVIYIKQLLDFYNHSRERIRTIQDMATSKRDKAERRQRHIDDALSDGPLANNTPSAADTPHSSQPEIRVQLTDDDNPRHITQSTTPVTSAFDIKPVPKTVTAQLDDIEQPANVTDEQESPEAGFTINQAAEIEQAKSTKTDRPDIESPYDPRADLSRYRMPPLSLLHDRPQKTNSVDLAEQEENKERITKTLNDYGIQIVNIEATVGPTITLYEIIPAEGVRIARIKGLEDDIAMSLAALGIRIIAPIPGKGTIGIEVPNKDPQTVSIRSILGSKKFQECKYPLPMALGATISNEVYIADLTKMPHMLVAGATGQGKSVGLNTIIASLLYKRHPAELKFVMVDPKMVEFSLYARIEKHYLAKLPDEVDPVVTDPLKAVDTLNSLCIEMDQRYALLKDAGCRNVIEYNDKFINRHLNPEKGHRYMPYIVMIVDEFADLIMTAGKSVETPIARIAQKARAVGMHMIIATQRPSTNVITGIIKANFPARIAFRVSQMVDSRTILDAPGANQLIGRGDMLISTGGTFDRVQCAFIDTDEVEALCQFIDNQVGYPTAYILPEPPNEAGEAPQPGSLGERDALFNEIARMVVMADTASTSNIQRKYSIGYNRAGKIMDQLEAAGIVGAASGGKPRQVLVDPTQLEGILAALS